MSWLLRPVDQGYCRYVELVNGDLDLCDVALMNDAIDVRSENEYRISKARAGG